MKKVNARELYTDKYPVMTLVEGVCVRPMMYTPTGTLEEACAFFEGFYSGMASHNRSEEAQIEVHW